MVSFWLVQLRLEKQANSWWDEKMNNYNEIGWRTATISHDSSQNQSETQRFEARTY